MTSKDTATIGELSVKLDGAIAQLTELKIQFNSFQSGFIRQDVYNIRHEELVKQVAMNQKDLEALKKNRWIMPTVSLVLGGVLAFLINYALTHKGG